MVLFVDAFADAVMQRCSDAELAATLGAGSEGIICQLVDNIPAAQSTDAVSTRL